jgi:cytoskeletal protein CcmA (bactofilin family)
MSSEAMAPADDRLPAAKGTVLIGTSVVIKGELGGTEDLTIEGRVEGRIELPANSVTIGQRGRVKAHVVAKSVFVLGELIGNITASESVEVRESASVDGDIVAPRVLIAQGSHFRGSIDMQRSVQPHPQPSDRRKEG